MEKGGDLYRGHIVRTYKNTDLIDIDYVVGVYKILFLFSFIWYPIHISRLTQILENLI